MYTFDHGLFMALNFDGGTALDRVMLTISGTAMWLPLYASRPGAVGHSFGHLQA